MKKTFNYLLILILLSLLSLYLLLYSSVGKEYITNSLSRYLSLHSKKNIKVENIDVDHYPKIKITMKFNQKKIDITGEFEYHSGVIFKGVTSSFGGHLYFDYSKKKSEILFRLEKVSLEKVLKSLSYPVRMRANIFGTILYDIENRVSVFDNSLKDTRIIENRITKGIFLTTTIDMTKYIYDKSTFVGYYHKSVLHGTLMIDSGQEHISFKELQLNSETKEITSSFDLKMDGQELYGELYGTTSEPKFYINIPKLIKYQFDKKVKDVDNEVDSFSKKAKSLFNVFF